MHVFVLLTFHVCVCVCVCVCLVLPVMQASSLALIDGGGVGFQSFKSAHSYLPSEGSQSSLAQIPDDLEELAGTPEVSVCGLHACVYVCMHTHTQGHTDGTDT